MVAMGVLKIYEDPMKASDPEVIALLAGGSGLIAAEDGNKTGTAVKKGPAK
jgi:hypothetical protein